MDERLQNVDPKMVELIMNEVCTSLLLENLTDLYEKSVSSLYSISCLNQGQDSLIFA